MCKIALAARAPAPPALAPRTYSGLHPNPQLYGPDLKQDTLAMG